MNRRGIVTRYTFIALLASFVLLGGFGPPAFAQNVVEAASIVEKRLAADPAAVYPFMDDGTRDRYRSAVERLAQRAGVSESEVCEAALVRL